MKWLLKSGLLEELSLYFTATYCLTVLLFNYFFRVFLLIEEVWKVGSPYIYVSSMTAMKNDLIFYSTILKTELVLLYWQLFVMRICSNLGKKISKKPTLLKTSLPEAIARMLDSTIRKKEKQKIFCSGKRKCLNISYLWLS